ncbi:MAG: tetratricopeptide repeat protein [Acidobacteria bacterium]|nr:tetratricopeptide repeat protein [Acidobacteriota bacterium]
MTRTICLQQMYSALASAMFFLLLTPSVFAQQQQPNRSAAMERGRAQALAKDYETSIATFGELVRQNPLDLEARNWIARVESWRGNLHEAEHVYRSVLEHSPENSEAELGLADVLLWQGRSRKAEAVLSAMLHRNPENTEILLRLARVLERTGRRQDALAYYQKVLRTHPENTDAREAMDRAVSVKRFRFEAGYYREQLNFASDTNGQFLDLLYRKTDRLNITARFEYQNKFGENETRFTVGSAYRLGGRTWLRAETSQAPRSNTVISNQAYTAEITRGVFAGVALGTGYSYLLFRDAKVKVWSVLLNWDPRSDLHFHVRYLPNHTGFDAVRQSVWNHSGAARLVWDAHRRFSPYLLTAFGNESFSGLSTDKLGRFSAQIYGGGAELRYSAGKGFRAGYHIERRTQQRRQHVFEFSHYFEL